MPSRPPKATLSTLPPEIFLLITCHLEFPFTHYLRLTNRALFALIPPTEPTLHELRCFEVSPFGISKDLLICNSCKKLLPTFRFQKGAEPHHSSIDTSIACCVWPHYINARARICNVCGVRPLPGEFRYQEGWRWEFEGREYVRCEVCMEIWQLEEEGRMGECPCYYDWTEQGEEEEKWKKMMIVHLRDDLKKEWSR